MNFFREIPPTAGWPIGILSLTLPFFKKYPATGLAEEFRKYLQAPNALVTCSGTAAFYIILESIRKISDKKTVIIPAFACPLIPLAIKKAGLKVKLCDTNRNNLDFDLNALRKSCAEDKDILAVLAVHLGGIPSEIAAIAEVTQKERIFLIEDCAQSLGAEHGGKKTGSFGDFSFFSLCRGKGLTIYEGGVAITNRAEYSEILNECARKFMRRKLPAETLKIAELFAYSIFYRPFLFWFAFRLPQIYWLARKNPVRAMGEYFRPDFPVYKISRFREAIGYFSFGKVEENISAQRRKTAAYLSALKEIAEIKPVIEPPQTKASYPYLTLIFADTAGRNVVLNRLQNSGLGASVVYLRALPDYPYLNDIIGNADCPGARLLAERTMTLSTSTFLRNNELNNIIKIIKTSLKGS